CTLNYCSLYRRNLWKECGGYDATMKDGYEDWDFWLSAAERGWGFRLLPEILFFYRKHGHSLSAIARAKHEDLVLLLKQKHPSLFCENAL
ncbi:MAG: glycosyltransferase family 2 protein, partial [Bacteroidota bacterium]